MGFIACKNEFRCKYNPHVSHCQAYIFIYFFPHNLEELSSTSQWEGNNRPFQTFTSHCQTGRKNGTWICHKLLLMKIRGSKWSLDGPHYMTLLPVTRGLIRYEDNLHRYRDFQYRNNIFIMGNPILFRQYLNLNTVPCRYSMVNFSNSLTKDNP